MILLGNAKTTYNLSRITERLYCGGLIVNEEEVNFLIKEGITHVIDATAEYDDGSLLHDHPIIKYLWNPTKDDGERKPKEWFDKAIRYALNTYQEPRKNIYVHCAAGVNRGPSLAYAILRSLGMSRREAFEQIKVNRPQAMIAYKADADKALIELGWTNDGLIGQ